MDRTFTCCLLHLWWVPIFDYLHAHENFLKDRISERERNVTVKAPSSPFLTVVIDRLMEARRTRAISLRRELHEATRNEDDLTAHPDNQTIGSKDDVPASRHGQRIIFTISSGRNLWPVLPRDRSGERGLMAAERPQNDHHAHCGASRTSVQDEAARRAARSSQEQPGEQPGAARSSQESTRSSPKQHFTTNKNVIKHLCLRVRRLKLYHILAQWMLGC